MTNSEFRAIRHKLGLSQARLAAVVGFKLPLSISTMERPTNPRPVPELLARLMRAYESGYRPDDWPL